MERRHGYGIVSKCAGVVTGKPRERGRKRKKEIKRGRAILLPSQPESRRAPWS